MMSDVTKFMEKRCCNTFSCSKIFYSDLFFFEHLIVNKFLLPALPLLNDQFTFRPTGSTTAALVYVLHHITRMLEDSSDVRCLFIDYSRAFDTINHELLIRKLLSLAMPCKAVCWIVNFLTGRTQQYH
jgi:Reverse transcriptase (RNA-dependent DNA polymerase)